MSNNNKELKTGVYAAGIPSYARNFSRDSFIYGLLAGDEPALVAQVDYSSRHQGQKQNPNTGEEPGKIHHELPAGMFRSRPTTYNACDTTALYLLAIVALYRAGNKAITRQYKTNIQAGIEYIQRHVAENIFIEDPQFSGADSFSLNVTYWKDSVLGFEREEPSYPITYSLVHFLNAYALRCIGDVLQQQQLIAAGEAMTKTGIKELWRGDHFVTAIDEVDIDPISSDSLHSLLYIPRQDLPNGYAKHIARYSRPLETKAGYLAGIVEDLSDNYHTNYVWVFEQALLHAAAEAHSLPHVAAVAEQVELFMEDSYPELIDARHNFAPAGNNPQLWSVGAKRYLEKPSGSFFNLL